MKKELTATEKDYKDMRRFQAEFSRVDHKLRDFKQKVKEVRNQLKYYFCRGIFHKCNKKEFRYILPVRCCPTYKKKYPQFIKGDYKIVMCKECKVIHKILKELKL